MNTNIYQAAARRKLRFDTNKGSLSVEDLFDLPLTSNTGKTNLDDLAKDLYRKVKAADDVASFVDDTRTASDTDDALALEIIKDVIGVKKAERDARRESEARAAQKQKIMALIEQKKDAALGEKTIEDLEAELAKL